MLPQSEQGYNEIMREERKRALRSLFKSTSTDKKVKAYQPIRNRIILWIKTFICLIVDATYGDHLISGKILYKYYDESTENNNSGTYCDFTCIHVSPKLFSDWEIALIRHRVDEFYINNTTIKK